jgi:hypothetical protein
MNKAVLLIISIILIIFTGIFFRFYQIGNIPGSLYWDEVAMLVDARMIEATGADMHGNHWFQALFPSYGDYKLPIYIWLTSIAVTLQGYGELAVRTPSAVAGVLSIVVSGGTAWFVTKNKVVSLATMLVLATAPWSIVFSRTGFESHLGQMFLGVSILVLLVAHNVWNKNKQISPKKVALVAGIVAISVAFGAIATYSYFSVRFVWPVVWVAFLIYGFFDVYQKNSKNAQFVKSTLFFYSSLLATGLILSQVLLVPMYTSDLYQVSNQFRLTAPSILNKYDHALDSVIIRDLSLLTDTDTASLAQTPLISQKATRVWYHRHWLLLRSFLTNLSEQQSPTFWFVSGDQNLRHGTGKHGLFVLPLFIPAFIGVYTLAKNRKTLLFPLLVWILVAMVPAAVPMEVPHALRSLNALIPAALIIGFGIAALIEWARQSKVYMLFVVLFGTAWIVATMQFWLYYTGPYNDASATHWQAGYREEAFDILVEAEKLEEQNQELILDHSDERFYLWLLAKPFVFVHDIKELEMENYQPTKIKNIVVDR